MRKSVRSFILKSGLVALALSLNFFAACEIGLGSSVDTEAPKIDFADETVASGAVVRDAFAVFGTFDDDGSIDSVKATLTNLSTSEARKKDGELLSGKKWRVSFNPAEEGIKDGSYELVIVIKDTAKHDTKITRAFTIDNTAPLVVLSRPSTKNGASSFDSYGQKFTLEGKAADDNDVSLIEVNVYSDPSCSGTPLKTISIPNVPLTIETDVAEYDKKKANDYSVIYGHVDASGIAIKDGTTEKRYCKLVVYDGAQRYPADGSAQSEEDKKGNSVDHYYLSGDEQIANLFTAGYKITELYHILNGSYSGSASRSISTSSVVELLANPENQVTCGQFSLNPENSPHFVVSARNTLEDGHSLDEYPITNGNSPLEVEISPGLDGHIIQKNTVGVYLVKCDLQGNPLKENGSPAANEDEAKKICLIKEGEEFHKTETEAAGLTLGAGYGIYTVSGSTYKFKTTQNLSVDAYGSEGLTVGENYYVKVVGKDLQPNDIMADGLFGFQFVTSGKNIEVGVTVTPEWLSTNSSATKGTSVSVELTYSTENKPFKVFRGVGKTTLEDNALEEGINTSPYTDNTVDISSEPTTLVYKLEGDQGAVSNVKTIELKYDDVPPAVPTITTCPDKNIADPDNLTFQGKAEDNAVVTPAKPNGSGIEHVYVQFWNGEEADEDTATVKTAELEATYSGAGKDWLFVMQKDSSDNTIKQAFANVFASEGKKTIKIISEDKVGLKNTAYKEFIYDKAAPVVRVTGSEQTGDAAVSTVPEIAGKTIKLTGSITEGYGIKSITIEQQKLKADGTADGSPKTRTITVSSSWESPVLPFKSSTADYSDTEISDHDADGTYTYKIIVTDNADKKGSVEKTIQLNTKAPTITPETDFSKWYLSKNVMISGTASSPATITGIYYKVADVAPDVPSEPMLKANWTNNNVWEAASGTTSWAFTAAAQDSAANKVHIAAVDNVGNVTDVKTLTLKVDSTSPDFGALFYNISGTSLYKAVEGQIYVDSSKTLTVYGKYHDGESGVKALSFTSKVTPTITYSTGTITGEVTADKVKALTYNTTISNTTNTKITYWKAEFTGFASNKVGEVKASGSNNAGGDTGEQKLFNISYDDKKPVVSNVSFKTTAAAPNKAYPETADAAEYWVNNKVTDAEFVVEGVATDNFGVEDIKLTLDGAEVTRESTSSVSEWKYKLPLNTKSESDTVVVKIQATDVAGKVSEEKSFTIHFDQTKPLPKHWADAKNKDVYFRIGSADNDYKKKDDGTYDTTKNEAGNNWSATLDKDVGSKYSFGSFGNDSTIEIRGTFKEEGSGLKTIYYKIYNTSVPSSTDLTNLASGELPTGYKEFAPLTIPEKRRVPYNVDANGTKASVEIESNYRVSLPGFDVQNNYLVLIAEDYVGNRQFDMLKISDKLGTDGKLTELTDSAEDQLRNNNKWNSANHNTETSYLNLNKDTDAPSITTDTTKGLFTNGTKTIDLTGKASDSLSGLKSVTVSIDEKVGTGADELHVEWSKVLEAKELTGTGTNKDTWSVTIPVDAFKGKDKNNTIKALPSGTSITAYATASDSAGVGNKKTISAATITIDTEAPTVEINNPKDADTTDDTIDVNGTIEISGTSNDAYGVESVLGICYTTTTNTTAPAKPGKETLAAGATWSAPSGWTKLADTTTLTKANATTNWTYQSINTVNLSGSSAITDGTNVWFTVAVMDNAGNVGYATPEMVKVDQNTDRPVVKFTNLTYSNNEYILKFGDNSRLEGNISDDDADTIVVDTFVVSNTKLTAAPTSGSGGWTKKTLNAEGTEDANGNYIEWSHAANGTTKYNKLTGDYTYTPANTGDGEKEVYFFVKDNNGKIFYTAHTNNLNKPYQKYKSDDKADNAAVLTYKSDSTAPSIKFTKLQAYNSSKTAEGTKEDVSAATVLGGTKKKYAKFEITALDANEIAEIRLTLNYKKKSDNTSATLKWSSKTGTTGFTQKGEHTGTGKDEEGEDNDDPYVWTTDFIDVSDYKTESVTGTVEVVDKSGLLGNASPTFFVDNTGPTANITSPSSTEELTGTQKFVGISTDTGAAGTETTAWLIPTLTEAAKSDEELAKLSTWNSYLNGTSSASAWEFELSTATLAAYDSATYTSEINDGVYTLPFYVKTTDALGNYTINKTKTFKHNPDADRPKTEITYPNASNYAEGKQYLTLGGTIRVTGTSMIPSGTTTVNAVYLQVIKGNKNKADGGTYTESKDYVSGLKHGEENCYNVRNAAQAATDLGFTNLTFATGVTSSDWWGIKANNAASWNITINNNGEMNPPKDQLTYIAIRACAINAEGKVGTWTDWYYINIDDTAPTQDGTLYQFETTQPSAGCAAATIIKNTNVKASNAYESEMYLKGDWYLTVKLHDESAIESYVVKKGVDTLTAGTGYYASTLVTGSDGKEKTQYLFIPVDTSNPGVAYTVTVNDTEHSITQTYSMKIDNNAPEIDAVYKGEADVTANYLDDSGENKVFDANYVYTLGGKITEEASGFERLVFYYVRDDGVIDGQTYTNKNILDPLITTGTNASKAAISGLEKRPFTQGSSTYYLYSKKVSGKLGADGYTFTPTTASNITSDKHIRVGGLIEANGVLRRIMSIGTDGKVTFDTNTSVTAETSADVYFPYAQVVDNPSTEVVESSSANPFTFKGASPDDGDGMPESVGGSKSTGYNWTSNIHSTNIPDGPCALVVLAFDKAGNVSGKTYKVAVENSAPRLAKVWLGTDLNSSNSWESGEFVGYDLYNANNTYGIANTEVKAKQTIQTANYGSAFKIKDKLAVIAEIIGGNGDIMMVYGKGAANENPVAKAITNANAANEKSNVAAANTTITSLITAGDKIGTVTYNQAQVSTSLKAFTLTSQQVAGLAKNGTIAEATADGTGKAASFTFWDSTDELDKGSTSQNCVLRVTDFTIDLHDGVYPKVVINPFYWKDETENSLFGNSKANGHIDLEADWKTAPGYVSSATTGQYDKDPKVSGKITFTGTAYDDHVLKTLSFTLKNNAATPVTYLSGTMATYTPATGWDKTSGNSGSAIADGGSYEWTISTAETEATRHYGDTAYLAQGGHKIYWTLSIDSSLISDVAAADVTLTVTTTDLSNNSSASSSASAPTVTDDSYVVTDGTTHVPAYRMDIVPYITGLTRPNAKTSTHRSRKGKYQVVLGETVTINGFNLPGKVDDKIVLQTTANKGGTDAGTIKETLDATAGDKDSMSFTIPATSGYIRVITGNITSMNNVNSGNEIESDYDGDEWTDDVYLSVWKNDEYFYFSNDPVSPSMDRIKYNNTDEDVRYRLYGGWATQGSSFFASYPNTTGSGKSGNAPNPASGTSTTSTSSQNFGDPATFYDVAVVGQNRYNVLIDCWQGNNNMNTTPILGMWGRNFVINKNGIYGHQGCQGNDNGNPTLTSSADLRNVIERMGGFRHPDTADSSDGQDEMFNQFLNPRIAVSSSGNAYLTYYDRYAKCLKWAMVGDFNNQNSPQTKYATEGNWISGAYQTGDNIAYNDRFGNRDHNYNLAKYYTNGGMVVAGYDTTQNDGTKSNLDVGKWSDIAVESTTNEGSGKPVIAYYDTTNKRLMVATSASATYPVNTNTPVVSGTATSATEGNAWTRQVVTGSANLRLGEYVSIALDGGNNVHIACKGAKEGALYYIYGARSAYGTYTWTTTCVDNNGSPGNWTDIKLTTPSASGAAAGPVISYYDPTNDDTEDALKVAYLESDGKWDDMTVPCNSAATANRVTLALDVTDGASIATQATTTNNSKLAVGYVSSRFDCVYLRKE